MSSSNTGYRTAIVQRFWDGRTYQLFAAPDELLLYHVGGDFVGLKSERMQKTDAPLRPLGERDVRIRADQVDSIRVTCMDSASTLTERLRIRLKMADGGSLTITPYRRDEEGLIRALQDFAPDRRTDPDGVFTGEPTPEQSACNSARAAKLRILIIALTALYLAIDIPWLFLDTTTPTLEALSLAVLPLTLLLYALFPNELTLTDRRRRAGSRVRIPFLLFLSAFTHAVDALDLYPCLNWRAFLLMAGALFLACMAVLALATREWKRHPTYLFFLALALICYLPGLTAYANVHLDADEPTVVQATVIGGHRSEDGDYLLRLDIDRHIRELPVTAERYQTTPSGAEVSVPVHAGFLGIPYVERSILLDSHAASATSSNM